MEKIKLLESNCTPELEKTINAYLKKGWSIKGGIVKDSGSLTVMVIKK